MLQCILEKIAVKMEIFYPYFHFGLNTTVPDLHWLCSILTMLPCHGSETAPFLSGPAVRWATQMPGGHSCTWSCSPFVWGANTQLGWHNQSHNSTLIFRCAFPMSYNYCYWFLATFFQGLLILHMIKWVRSWSLPLPLITNFFFASHRQSRV